MSKSLVAGPNGGGVLLSTDSGANWRAVDSSTKYWYITSLAESGKNMIITPSSKHSL